MDEREKIKEVVSEIVKDKLLRFLKRFCQCVRARREYGNILNKEIIESINKAIEEKQDIDLGIIKIFFKKKLIGHRMCVEYRGETYCNDDAMSIISRIRSLYEWYRSDCDLNNILTDSIENNDFNLMTFVEKNIEKFEKICEGELIELDTSMLDDVARRGVDRAIKEYLSSRSSEKASSKT
ncbi:MAG: hypothetical protein GXO10_02035 [Crenarchaeota archaeon]|nr:hypothetical protein [Thermoproteota archaeon]